LQDPGGRARIRLGLAAGDTAGTWYAKTGADALAAGKIEEDVIG